MSENKKEKYVLSEESARDQLDLLLDAYGIDLEFIENAYPDVAAASGFRLDMFRNLIRRGLIEIISAENGDVSIKQNFQPAIGDKTSAVYKPYSGATNVSKFKDGSDYATRMCNVLGSLSGLGSQFFASKDLKMLNARVADEIYTFFVGIF